MEQTADVYYYVNGQYNFAEKVGVYGFTKIEYGELKYTKIEVIKNASAPRCQLCAIAYAASDASVDDSVIIYTNDRNALSAITRSFSQNNMDVVERFNFYKGQNPNINVVLRPNNVGDNFLADLKEKLHNRMEQLFLPKIEKVMSRKEYAFVMNLRKLMKDFNAAISGVTVTSHDMHIDIPKCNADNILQMIELKANE